MLVFAAAIRSIAGQKHRITVVCQQSCRAREVMTAVALVNPVGAGLDINFCVALFQVPKCPIDI